MTLYCMVCHTRWVEQVLSLADRCPFRDCTGHLTAQAPTARVAPKAPRPRPTFPLLALTERKDE